MTTSTLAYPMHGQYKLSNEGYRTRDGHIIEWLGRFRVEKGELVSVVSRPEPFVLAPLRRVRGGIAAGTEPVRSVSWKLPKLDPKHWWVRSAQAYPTLTNLRDVPAVVWNPFVASAPIDRNPYSYRRRVVFDLLDDWTIHHAFASIRKEVEAAYRRAFSESEVVFANSEGTLALAHRFGRSDAILMTNGVDPDRFVTESRAQGPLTIGYVGKIGRRLDAALIANVCRALPEVRFVFAGSFLDPKDGFRRLLTSLDNVEVLGDVHYEDVPELMATFDLGWVPHAVGEGEVGGDAIKTYEYRATGLQVLTTPIIGAGRTLTEGVHVVPATSQVDWLKQVIRGRERIDRRPAEIPEHLTWSAIAKRVDSALESIDPW